jgi:hypothetical protein
LKCAQTNGQRPQLFLHVGARTFEPREPLLQLDGFWRNR